jgi:thiamine-phosphate pyrophosphorylase
VNAASTQRRASARARLAVLLVTDRAASRAPLEEAVAASLAGGVTAVMLREKDLGHDELVRLGRSLAAACRDADALLLVNHDVAAARELGADGVHLGFRSVGVREARAMLGEDALVGRSTHDADEIDRAILDGADYVTFGPVHDTPSKRGLLAPRGVASRAAAARRAGDVPVVALGGVSADAAPEMRRAGAAGVACIREILAAEDPQAAARRLRDAWEGAA